MTDSITNVTVKKKRKFTNDKNELLKMDKEELADLLIRMESHNQHLKNIIAKLDASPEDCETAPKRKFDFTNWVSLSAMNKALPDLVGSHDFRNLCKMDIGNGVVKFVRTIIDVKLTKLFSDPFNKSSGYDMYTLTISSEGFLWHQIRCIMAVLILIGEGKESPSIIKELLDTEKHP
ncbi:hypothetical protein LSTR_LSTR014492, partial [Laodelphax striatellus]